MKKKLLFILAVGFLAVSCKKDSVDLGEGQNTNLNDLTVSAQFDWKTTKDINVSVAVNDARFSVGDKHVITIYAGNPAAGGQVLSKGAATQLTPFNTKISIAAMLSEIYVVKTAPDGSKVSGAVSATSANLSVSASESDIVGTVSGINTKAQAKTSAALKGASVSATLAKETAPAVPAGAVTMTQNTNNPNGNTVYLAENITVQNLNFNNSGTEIYVRGNVTLSGNLQNGVKIYVLAGATLSLQNANYNGPFTLKNFGSVANLNNFKLPNGAVFYNDSQSLNISLQEIGENATFTNFGNVTLSNGINYSGSIKNGGTITHNGQLNSNGANPSFYNTGVYTTNSNPNIAGLFDNSGSITINSGSDVNFNGTQASFNSGTITASNAKLNVSGNITNNGSMIARELNFTGSSNIKNYCKLYATQNATFDGPVANYSYIYIGTSSKFNGPGILTQYSYENGAKAMFSTGSIAEFAGNSNFKGEGSAFSLVKIRQQIGTQINANGNKAFTGKTYVIKPSGQSINNNRFSGGATVLDANMNYYIEKNACNDEGNGTAPAPVKPDTDGDGILDEEDNYPNDATKAFDQYSLNYTAGGSSVAFEDSWPSKGDYDLNDIVITYRYLLVSNSDNKLVHIKADYKLLATGGAFRNGAGVQFNLPAGSAKNFQGAAGTYLESGQDSVVVILFENSRNEQTTWNTDLTQAQSEVKEYAVSFDIENGPSVETFGVGLYNPFIWNNSQGFGRGYETHLIGKHPTKKANSALFGTENDNSVAGRRYTTTDNLPYALEIPTAPFRYPQERVAITDVYLKFSQWAGSGGAEFIDWYTNNSSGYVDSSKIYTR